MQVNQESKLVGQDDDGTKNHSPDHGGQASPGFGRRNLSAEDYSANDDLDYYFAEFVTSYDGHQYEEASQGARKNDPGQ